MVALAASRQFSPALPGARRAPLAPLLSLTLHGAVAAAVAAWGMPAIDAPPALIVEFVAPAPAAAAPPPAPAAAAETPAPAQPAPAEPEPAKPEPAKPEPRPLPAAELPAPRPVQKPVRLPRRATQPVSSPVQAAAPAETAAPAELPAPAPSPMSQIAAPATTPATVPAAALAEPPVVTDARFRRPPRPPAYPPRALALEQEGISVIRALIDTDGSSREVRLWRSSGFALLDQAALAAVRDWAFEAARRGEQPVLAWVEVPVRFEIR